MERYWELTRTLPNQENQEVVGYFLRSLKSSNRSELTILRYRRFLEWFFEEMEDTFSSLSSDKILDWLQTNRGQIKDSTYRKRLDVLSSFYNFCVQDSLLERSPIKRRWFPRLPKPLPKYLEKGDIAKVRNESERTSLRNQAIVEFMLTSGCRISEVCQLNIEDVDLENRTARVVGKGKKIRNVHFSEKCAILLDRYSETRQEMGSSPLFVTKRKKTRLDKGMIYRIVKMIGEDAGLLTKLHPHRLRHTFATELLAKGAELSFISDELGHANLETTQIYARLPNQQIISQYRKFMG
ncbi:integrase/recombinase XerD [Bacillus sp. OV194]|nr:integrase/recombinase XerD [Bacillus sp. OV194]